MARPPVLFNGTVMINSQSSQPLASSVKATDNLARMYHKIGISAVASALLAGKMDAKSGPKAADLPQLRGVLHEIAA